MSNPFAAYGENDPDIARAIYGSLTPAKIAECEQFYARAKEALHRMSKSLMTDIEFRQQTVGVIDDSVQYCMLAQMITALAMCDEQSFYMTTQMLAAAMFELARNQRAASDPLAHLEDDQNGEQS
jgi:hypothetical protein